MKKKLNVLQVQGVLKYLLQTQRNKDREIKKLKEEIKDLQSYKEFLVDSGIDNASPNSKNPTQTYQHEQQDSQYQQFQKVQKQIDRISESILDESEEFIRTKTEKSPPAENIEKREQRSLGFQPSVMSTPIGTVHKNQAVKAGNYINVPVKYCPANNNNHLATMEVIGEDKDSVILKTTQTDKDGKQDSQQHKLQKVNKSGEFPAMQKPAENNKDNGGKCSVGFQSFGLGTPFVTMHEKLVVQAGNYINVPVRYCPVSNSKHVATMEVIGKDLDNLILKTTMKGRCI